MYQIFSHIYKKDVINLKKIIKRLLAVGLATVIMISCFALGAFAKDTSIVEYKSGSTWSALIPDTIKAQNASEDVNSAAYTVKTQNVVLGDGESLVGTIEYSGNLTEGNVNLPYSIYNSTGSIVENGSKIITQVAGDPTAEASFSFGAKLNEKAKYSGNYLGTATFTFSVAEKTYTLDEINADEHLYAIGKTKPEYVVAKFNDDYSSVRIIKNGDDSDGLMKDFQRWKNAGYGRTGTSDGALYNVEGDPSPAVEHCVTLRTAIVEDGVKNIGAGMFSGIDIKKFGDYIALFTDGGTASGYVNDVLLPQLKAKSNLMGLTAVSIANSVEEIGDFAFYQDTALGMNQISSDDTTKTFTISPITIPGSVKKIGEGAFYTDFDAEGYPNARIVNLNEGLIEIGKGAFHHSNQILNGDNSSCWLEKGVLLSSDVGITGDEQYYKRTGSNGSTKAAPVEYYNLFKLPSTVEVLREYAFDGVNFAGGAAAGITLPESITDIETNALPNDRGFKVSASSAYASGRESGVTHGEANYYVKAGSYAETWAKTNNISYVVDERPDACGNILSWDEKTLLDMPIKDYYTDKDKTTLVFPEGIEKIVSNFQASGYTGRGNIYRNATEIILPKSLKVIGNEAFSECSFTDITLPEGLEVVGERAFEDDNLLRPFFIPNSVTTIGQNAFSGQMTYIKVAEGNQNFSSVDGGLFSKDKKTLIRIPMIALKTPLDITDSSVTEEELMNAIITDYRIPEGVTKVESYAFDGNQAITSISIPESVSVIGDLNDGKSIFNCYNCLTEINVAEGNSTFSSADGVLFTKDKKTLLRYPNGRNAKTYSVPDGVTSIKNLAFDGDGSLTSIIIPASVTNIDTDALKNNNKQLKTIYGTAGSYAETWAKNNGYTFVAQ